MRRLLALLLCGCGTHIVDDWVEPTFVEPDAALEPDVDLFTQEDAAEEAPAPLPLPTLQGTFLAALPTQVVRVTMPSASVVPVFKLPTIPSSQLTGFAKRPDKTIDLLFVEKGMVAKTHVQTVDAAGTPIGSERTFDGVARGGDYGQNQALYVGWYASSKPSIAMIDVNGLSISVTPSPMSNDVAWIKGQLYVTMPASGEDLPVTTMIYRYSPPQFQMVASLMGNYHVTPLADQIVAVSSDGWIHVIDPSKQAHSAVHLGSQFQFLDATED